VSDQTQAASGPKVTSPSIDPPAFGTLDLLPDIILPNEDSKLVQLSIDMTGKCLLLLFCPDLTAAGCRAGLSEFASHFEALAPLAHIYAVTSSPPQANLQALESAPLPFPILSDLQRHVARGLAIGHNLQPAEGPGAVTMLLADENRRVLRIDHNVTGEGSAKAILAQLSSRQQSTPRMLGGFAPVLYIPQVLEPSFCAELIAAFETGKTEEGTAYRHGGAQSEGEYVVDPKFKVRRDHHITDRELGGRLRWCVARRVKPEILKAFTREISGIEEFKVVCYDASNGGHFSPHRDNISPKNAHRLFAMTLNLNSEFEGGGLRFPEYGDDLYRPSAGDAVVFSCSLMHQAMPVTKGRRFVLLSFLYDEESRRQGEARRRAAQSQQVGRP
jgi:peroxiredoxin/predicted 2-oxoglutarate/Fe(II)-dependent dioxygenase YbiX